jgi:glyoxylase-like metal-dependent hydrolase (beta-lactamase superfamily II)
VVWHIDLWAERRCRGIGTGAPGCASESWSCTRSDGTFIARPGYFADDVAPDVHPEFFSRQHAAWLPIGCFLVRAGSRLVLVDAGLGPELRELPGGMHLVGGQLPTGLRALGVAASDITDVICSHFHADHVGWLFGLDACLIFPRAVIWFGAADWRHFVTGPGDMLSHIREGFHRSAHASRLRPVDRDTTVAPGITALWGTRAYSGPPVRGAVLWAGAGPAPRRGHHLSAAA